MMLESWDKPAMSIWTGVPTLLTSNPEPSTLFVSVTTRVSHGPVDRSKCAAWELLIEGESCVCQHRPIHSVRTCRALRQDAGSAALDPAAAWSHQPVVAGASGDTQVSVNPVVPWDHPVQPLAQFTSPLLQG
jgi:hypothetical protein